MRIIKYDCHEETHLAANVQIDFSEIEIGTIDNALYYAKELEQYKNDKDFLEIRTKFHILREIINHGHVGADQIKFAYDVYEKLGKYECWKKLENKKEVEKTSAKFNQIDKLVDKLYLSGLTAKQIAVVEQIQDIIKESQTETEKK